MPRNEGDHLFKPGQSGNPTGRPKGRKNTLPTLVVHKVLDVWTELEKKKGKSLLQIAEANPIWFYEKFVRYLLPKNIDLGIFIGEHFDEEDLSSLPDDVLLSIVKGVIDKSKTTRKKKPLPVKGKVIGIKNNSKR